MDARIDEEKLARLKALLAVTTDNLGRDRLNRDIALQEATMRVREKAHSYQDSH